jgi:putative DNA primase/helicase
MMHQTQATPLEEFDFSASQPPLTLPVIPENIPDELKQRPQWVAWRWEYHADRSKPWTKIPTNAKVAPRVHHGTGELFFTNARSNGPTTWTTFDEAYAFALQHGLPGVGYVFSPDDPHCGVDFDNCREPITGIFDQWATEAIAKADTYTEISPSGTGAKAFLIGKLPGAGRKHGDVEMYDQGRFFATTGHHLSGSPATIEPRQEALDSLFAQFMPKKQAPKTIGATSIVPLRLDDTSIIRRAANAPKFVALFDRGDLSLYDNNWSRADQALCDMLAFWSRDREQIIRIWKQSALSRPKLDEKHAGDGRTYAEMTADAALDFVTDYYTGGLDRLPPSRNGHTPEPSTDKEPRSFALSDMGNAERLAAQHGTSIRIVDGLPHTYDARRWQRDRTGSLMRYAKQTVRDIYPEAAAIENEDERRALIKHALKSEGAERLKAMITLVGSEPGIGIVSDHLDADPWLLNCQNGTVDLRTGELRPHNRADLITKLAPADYDPAAKAPIFETFLQTILPDESLRRFVQRAFGYSMTGLTREHVIFILYGIGANGKTTLLEAVMDALGDYADTAAPDLLLQSRNDRHPTEIADLRGVRLVTATETGDGRRLAEATVKALTGSDRLKARYMRGDFFSFNPTHTIFLGTNYRPDIRGDDNGIWRRVRLLPFDVSIPDDQQDKELPEKLRREASGILAWLVQGCLAWQREGLGMPEPVLKATEAYRQDSDVLAVFLAEYCDEDPAFETTSADLYTAYREWCETNGEHPMKPKALALRLKARGFQSIFIGHGNKRGWKGLKVIVNTTMSFHGQMRSDSDVRSDAIAKNRISLSENDSREVIRENPIASDRSVQSDRIEEFNGPCSACGRFDWRPVNGGFTCGVCYPEDE